MGYFVDFLSIFMKNGLKSAIFELFWQEFGQFSGKFHKGVVQDLIWFSLNFLSNWLYFGQIWAIIFDFLWIWFKFNLISFWAQFDLFHNFISIKLFWNWIYLNFNECWLENEFNLIFIWNSITWMAIEVLI